MNKVLLLLACVPCTMFGVEKAAENMLKFMSMEQKHKQDWLDNKKASFDAKIEMLKRHKDQLFDLKKETS